MQLPHGSPHRPLVRGDGEPPRPRSREAAADPPARRNPRPSHGQGDPARPAPLTPEQKAELEALKALPDETIDTSDIPPLTDEFWRKAVRNPFYKPTKTSTTVRIDSDVLLWLRSQGPGYQSRINAIMWRAMLESLKG